MKKKLVLIGNGMAGVNCIEQILKLVPNRYDITIFGSEPHPNYNRIMLSSVLAGDADMNDIVINSWDWYRENNIILHAGHTVSNIDTKRKIVSTESGIQVPYDECHYCNRLAAFHASAARRGQKRRYRIPRH